MDQMTLLEFFYDPEYDCSGYCKKFKSLCEMSAENLIKLLSDMNEVQEDILQLIKEKLNEA